MVLGRDAQFHLFCFSIVELLSLNISHDTEFKGISIFNREIRISQLADDTTLFLKDKEQLGKAIDLVNQFSLASGLKLNVSKCELLPLHYCDRTFIDNIPVKATVKYLGIHITKNAIARQQLNFSGRIKKTRDIFNLWLQRDLTLYGRVLLSKAEGVSHFVYPSLSLFVNDTTANEINKLFLDFIWRNKTHKLKNAVLSNSRAEGGLEVLNFNDIINTFKINWLKRCLTHQNSLWFFIPNHIFEKIGGLAFVLTCNYAPDKLPVTLSKFHQQSLLSWKLCFIHNFSPHKTLLWNNECITIRNKSLFYSKWFNRSINNILSVLDERGHVLCYESFISRRNFPIPFKEYNSVIKAIPSGLLSLMKSHLSFHEETRPEGTSVLLLNGINIQDKKCNNKHIWKIFQAKKRFSPRGKFLYVCNSAPSQMRVFSQWVF